LTAVLVKQIKRINNKLKLGTDAYERLPCHFEDGSMPVAGQSQEVVEEEV
jgi:hypothetical protein